jgi:uncharacterized cupredoxin-like copper-binding protein
VAASPESGHDMSHLHTNAAVCVHLSAQPGQTATVSFTPTEPRGYRFSCTIPGHQEAGMYGTPMVTEPQPQRTGLPIGHAHQQSELNGT